MRQKYPINPVNLIYQTNPPVAKIVDIQVYPLGLLRFSYVRLRLVRLDYVRSYMINPTQRSDKPQEVERSIFKNISN